jgi:hypothetical protein
LLAVNVPRPRVYSGKPNAHKEDILTSKGRVVYDRKAHFWKPKDLLRVCKKLFIPCEHNEKTRVLLSILYLLSKIRECDLLDIQEPLKQLRTAINDLILVPLKPEDDEFKPGGGSFGGGGATWDW